MIRLLALLVSLCLASPADAAWTLVQSKSATASSLAFDSPVTSGNLVIIATAGFQTVTAVGDGTNTYVQTDNVAGPGATLSIWYKENVTGGSLTISLTNCGANCGIAIHEFSGGATASALDKHNGVATTPGSASTDADTSPSVTTTTDGQLIFGAIMNDPGSSGTFAVGTGYTLGQNFVPFPVLYPSTTEYKTQTSAGSVAATWTGNTTNGYEAAVATFKAAASTAVRHRAITQ